MLIGKNYKIESDALNVTLLRRSVAKSGKRKGEELWTQIGYFSSIGNALKHLVDLEVKEMKTVLRKQQELYQMIAEVKRGE